MNIYLQLIIYFVIIPQSLIAQYHIRPINIFDCNQFESIFIGKLIEKRFYQNHWLVYFEIEEEFKYRDTQCKIVLKEWCRYLDGNQFVVGERWLVFAEKFNGQNWFDSNRSWRLVSLPPAEELILRMSLSYLQEFRQNLTGEISETYMTSTAGAHFVDDNVYVGQGKLIEGYPHGEWNYWNEMNRYLHHSENYILGMKWGLWEEYWDNGYVLSRSFYYNNELVKRVLYDSNGDFLCLNNNCGVGYWNDEIRIRINSLQEDEKEGYCSVNY